MKNVNEHNDEKYFYHWWNRNSLVDRENIQRDYFAVFRDRKGRVVKIVKYNVNNIILYYECFSWRGSWLLKVEEYSPENVLQYIKIYHYDRFGFLVDETILSADGKPAFIEDRESDIIDKFGGWLYRLFQLPIIEARGLLNYLK